MVLPNNIYKLSKSHSCRDVDKNVSSLHRETPQGHEKLCGVSPFIRVFIAITWYNEG